MTTLTLQLQTEPKAASAGPGKLKKALRATRNAVKAMAVVAVTPHKASLRRLTEMPLTVAASGLLDWAGFHLGSGWGLAITGLSLVVLEHLISDAETPARRQ